MKTFTALLLLTVLAICQAADRNYDQPCKDGDKCLGDTECKKMDGCQYGKCLCPDDMYRTGGNTCKDAKKVGEECTSAAECYDPLSMECKDKKCACKAGKTANDDNKMCRTHVGDKCTTSCDNVRMECKSSKCACKANFKEDDNLCVLTDLGDDCSADGQCIAGTCKDKKCSCSSNLVAYINLCISKTAKKDIGKGEECKPSGDDGKYCAEGLSCKACPESSKRVCSGASITQSGFLFAVFMALLAVLRK